MVLKDNHYMRNSQNSQRLSKGLFTSQKKGSLEDMLRMPNLRTKLEARSPQKLSTKTVLTNIDDEIENLLSAEPPKRSIRKVWFSPVECKRRRSSWNPAAVPTKSLLKKVTKRSEASQSLKEGTLGNTTSTEKMATTDKYIISVISNEDVLPDTQETISEAARDSSEIRGSFGKRSLVGTHEESNETLLRGKRKRLGRTKANEEWSGQLKNATSSVDSSNEREERFKKNFPEKDCVYQNGEISASTSVEHAVTPQHLRRRSEAGGRSNGEGICVSSKSALNTHNILDASEEDVKQHDVSDITNLEPEASTISSNMRSRSAKSASPIIQHSLETRVSRRKRKMVIPDSNDVESHGDMLNQKVLRDLVTEGDTCVRTKDLPSISRPVENRRCSKRLSLERNDGNNLENFDKLECPLCPKRYAVAKSLRAHVVKVHREFLCI
ncbi:zinc finger, C2H2 type [Necator americanus]|uniref:Zinc finger, C2H2 type n=1 Tax=Necator americanus TaxID=51031 RepID=W2TD07_NECAM|nr:zinc finger, C2H2 type [Necator americanus]ETN79076.1 zinc finger, C2H2 type [Necator americanus]